MVKQGKEMLRAASVAGYVLGTTDQLYSGDKAANTAAMKREEEWLRLCVNHSAKWVLMPEAEI